MKDKPQPTPAQKAAVAQAPMFKGQKGPLVDKPKFHGSVIAGSTAKGTGKA